MPIQVLIVVDMAVDRPGWYPYTMLNRSRSSPLNLRRIPGSVESCLQWQQDRPTAAAADRDGVVTTTLTTTTTKSVEETRDVSAQRRRQQQQQQHRESAELFPSGYNFSTSQYDGRCTPYDARQNIARYQFRVFLSKSYIY